MGYRFAFIRGLSVAAAVFSVMLAFPAPAQPGTDPRILRMDDTRIVLFDGMVTVARQETYRVEDARSEVDGDGLPSAIVDISFTAADLEGGGCTLEMGRTDETDLEVVRTMLGEILSQFEAGIRNRSAASQARQGRVLTHGNSNSINSDRPYIATHVTSERGGLEVNQYWFINYNGRIHGYINECTLPGSADQNRLWSDFPIRRRR